MRKWARRLLHTSLIPLINYISIRVANNLLNEVLRPSVFFETIRRAVADSADYADSRMSQALCFHDTVDLRRHAFRARQLKGLVLEFGVYRGDSVSLLASWTEETIYGFDSFEGLKEDWKGWNYQKGHFDLGGVLPAVPANVTLIKGWFDESLPTFLRDHPEPFSFVHIDSDTYVGAASVLAAAGDRFRKGTVVIFDEYFGYRGWRMGEYKAWQEFVAARGLTYEYLAFSNYAVSMILT